MAAEDPLRVDVGMLAHIVNELVATVGLINASAVSDSEVREEVNDSLDELHALASRLAKAFPPPPEDGGRRRLDG